jgi:Na+/melibiose symporter-like transporter
MEHRATLEYSEPLLRRAAFAYWRRFVGSAYGVAVFVVAACFVALLRNGDRSWVVGVLGTCLVLALGFGTAVFVTHWRRSLGRFRRMTSRTASLLATETQLSLSSELGTSTLPWSGITQIWRYSEFWLLVLSQRQVVTLPLANLSGDVRAFIATHVQAAGGRVGA